MSAIDPTQPFGILAECRLDSGLVRSSGLEMITRILPFSAFLISPSLLACVESPVVQLSEESYEMLVEQLDREFPEIDARTTIRHVKTFGYTVADYAQVEFQPHRRESGADHYHFVGCKYSENGEWTCGEREERREVAVVGPDDQVRIADDIEADFAIRITKSIRSELFIDQSGLYSYSKYGKTEVSTEPLNLTYIYKNDEGNHVANATVSGACKVHRIVVREIVCGLDECGFEVVENEVLHQA